MDAPSWLEALRRALASGPALKLAVLFGSRATDSPRPDSDIDVAILPAGDLDLGTELRLQAELTLACGLPVDLVRLDHAPTLVRWQVACHGKPLLEAPRGAFARFQAQAASEYIEFAPALAKATELFRRRLAASRAPR